MKTRIPAKGNGWDAFSVSGFRKLSCLPLPEDFECRAR